MSRKVLVLLVLVAVSCGGRSKMRGPGSTEPGPTQPDSSVPAGPDARDGSPAPSDGPFGPERGPGPPEVPPSDPRPPQPVDLPPEVPPLDGPRDRPPVLPDVPPPFFPDVPPDRPGPEVTWLPEVGPERPPVLPEVAREVPPILPEVNPPGPEVGRDLPPDIRVPPDVVPPIPQCAAGAACTTDCSVACGMIGIMACACVGGTLACSACQPLPITISPDPCPGNPTGQECAAGGVACIAYGSSGISGACLCMARAGGDSLRWSCIIQ